MLYLLVFSDGAEEEKMETETDGQQCEKVSSARHAGSEKVVVLLTDLNYYVLKCLLREVMTCSKGTVVRLHSTSLSYE